MSLFESASHAFDQRTLFDPFHYFVLLFQDIGMWSEGYNKEKKAQNITFH